MNNQPFRFPPPPPAPPQAPHDHQTSFLSEREYHNYGGRTRGSYGNRGYGRGNSRGGPRGGASGYSQPPSGRGGYPYGQQTYSNLQHQAYNVQGTADRQDGLPKPNHTPTQLPHYPVNWGQGYGQQSSNFSTLSLNQQYLHGQYSQYPANFRQQHQGSSPHPSNGYGPPANGFNSADHNYSGAVPLDNKGGFESQPSSQPTWSNTAEFQNGLRDGAIPVAGRHSFGESQSNHYGPPNYFRGAWGRGQKRRHADAFEKPRNQGPRPRAAPAVPSFGSSLPLPTNPPTIADQGGKPKKRKRRHNQLGLTPKTEEHESSEDEEDDANEESRLAAAVSESASGSQLLQFEYKGQTSTLGSSSEIAAWINERKKRFPTKARAAEATERKKQRDQAHKAAIQARKEAQEQQRAEAKEKQRLKAETEQKKRDKSKEDVDDLAVKARRKVEKLRKKLEKEEKRVARVEAKASETGAERSTIAPGSEGSAGNKNNGLNSNGPNDASAKSEDCDKFDDGGIEGDQQITDELVVGTEVDHAFSCQHSPVLPEATCTVAGPLTPTSQPPGPDEELERKASSNEQKRVIKVADQSTSGTTEKMLNDTTTRRTPSSSASNSESSSYSSASNLEESTSSSGTSTSDSDSEEDAPHQESSRRKGPVKVAPSKREKPKRICKFFLQSGHCKRGDSCLYRHELPERGTRAARKNADERLQVRTKRVSLHQRLVDQEKEKEDLKILNAIIQLGEQGLLDKEVPDETAKT